MGNPKKENMRQQWAKIIAKSWDDEGFKNRLLKNPNQVLKEEGIEIPQNTTVHIHENSEKTIHFILPANTGEKLSEEQLASMAAGNCIGPLCQCR